MRIVLWTGGHSPHGSCWLKYITRTDVPPVMSKGEDSEWTSGIFRDAEEEEETLPQETEDATQVEPENSRKFHIAVTANAAPYVQWQGLVMDYHYMKQKQLHPNSMMGGWTRILHSGKTLYCVILNIQQKLKLT